MDAMEVDSGGGSGATSTKIATPTGSKVVTVATSNDATAAEPAEPSPDWLGLARAAKGKANGQVVVKYGHYKTAFPYSLVSTAGGRQWRCVQWKDIDEEYALSFVFQGDPHVHVRCYPPGTDSSSDPEATPVMPMAVGEKFTDGDTGERDASQDEMFFFLAGTGTVEGESFLIEVEEDEEAGIGGVAEGGGGGGINFATAEELGLSASPGGAGGVGGGARSEGCSCLYGNPCMDQYVCLDWANRFEVAKKNGWKEG
jgi:mannose-6-phosphate isomerase-like protein (cupin superfamily)